MSADPAKNTVSKSAYDNLKERFEKIIDISTFENFNLK